MSDIDIQSIASVLQDFGVWVLFAWLYMQEKKSHQETREQYRDDLREIANLRSNLNRVQTIVADTSPITKAS